MKKGFIVLPFLIIITILILLAWCPWVSENYAKERLSEFQISPTLTYVPSYSVNLSEKIPFGRKLIKVEESFGDYDFFVSALGTVHTLKKYDYSKLATQEMKEESPPDNFVKHETANWKTFTSKDGKHTISYPPDWTLTDNSEPSLDSPEYILTNIEISKNNHTLISYELDAWGPAICIFDKTTARQDGYPTVLLEKYVEIKAGAITYRRTETPETINNQLRWTICESNDGQHFITKGPFGITSYYSPLRYDVNMIKTIDQIISTFKSLE